MTTYLHTNSDFFAIFVLFFRTVLVWLISISTDQKFEKKNILSKIWCYTFQW